MEDSLFQSGTLLKDLGEEPIEPLKTCENSRVTMEIFMVQRPEVIDKLLGRRAENSHKIEDFIQALRTRCESDEEKRRQETVKKTGRFTLTVTGGPFTCC